jgi:large subunit ribosomal protein L10
MPTAKKIETVETLADRIARANIAIAGDYRGLTVAEITALRRALRDAGVDFRVVKNTLFRRAAEAAGKPYVSEIIEGPSAVIFAYDDPVQPAKAITDYIRTSRIAFAVRRGAMDGQLLSAADVQNLATLPSREQLIGQVVGAIISPLATLNFLLSSTLRQFAGLVDARANQLGGGESEATAG